MEVNLPGSKGWKGTASEDDMTLDKRDTIGRMVCLFWKFHMGDLEKTKGGLHVDSSWRGKIDGPVDQPNGFCTFYNSEVHSMMG